ncbi:ParB/RepB/Spo0J family partition protein [Paenibacillus spongiae]|uniref:ParB/RepB/Spo0J family partition protein n=1 Tax=Paenibacillus spongiae TaxID=2909671 RepID=A0ABY5SKX7_9BACL|nr:ParB/RepB/Spo0J family partition protein [Paenibacillus spongiae]UVI33310.1 ParB/RepB/Spo0J family partition protein [Paenibacillus spongiae]
MDNGALHYTCEEAKQFAARGQIEEWVHLYLNAAGNNPAFSEGLMKQKRHWVGPILVDVDRLQRCHGPKSEPDMEYYSSDEHWDILVGRYERMFHEGWDAPPLIIQHVNGSLSVRDGNRRTAALKRAGIPEYWVIIWDDDSADNIWNTLRK